VEESSLTDAHTLITFFQNFGLKIGKDSTSVSKNEDPFPFLIKIIK
jgi:hypothetical protein